MSLGTVSSSVSPPAVLIAFNDRFASAISILARSSFDNFMSRVSSRCLISRSCCFMDRSFSPPVPDSICLRSDLICSILLVTYCSSCSIFFPSSTTNLPRSSSNLSKIPNPFSFLSDIASRVAFVCSISDRMFFESFSNRLHISNTFLYSALASPRADSASMTISFI